MSRTRAAFLLALPEALFMVLQLLSPLLHPSPVLAPPGRVPSEPGGPSYSVLVVHSAKELEPYQELWDDLSRNALEPNVYYESWMFLPALRAFATKELQIVLVFQSSPDQRKDLLCGFFPLVRRWGYKGLPVGYLSLWQHDYCFLCLPLLRASCARQCLNIFFAWMANDRRGAALLECPCLPREGRVHQLLVDLSLQQSWLWHVPELFTRGVLQARKDADAYLSEVLSARQRKELRRKEKRLAELGRVELRTLQPGEDVSPWVEAFLALEASGWKGRQGTAMAARPADADFFRTLAREGAARGQLNMLGLFLNDRPIAVKCNLRSGEGSFAFKIAFDEALSRVSPGYQLEIATIRYLHLHPEIRWLDSCTGCGPSLFDQLYLDRRVLGTLLLASGRAPGDFIVSLLPLLRWLKRGWTRLWGRSSRPLPPCCSAHAEEQEDETIPSVTTVPAPGAKLRGDV